LIAPVLGAGQGITPAFVSPFQAIKRWRFLIVVTAGKHLSLTMEGRRVQGLAGAGRSHGLPVRVPRFFNPGGFGARHQKVAFWGMACVRKRQPPHRSDA